MKLYFDLSKKERTKYFKEFIKTPVGKEIHAGKMGIIFFALFVFAVDFLCSFVLDEYDGSLTITLFILIAAEIIYEVYTNVNFTAWLRNKYDIKRW